MPSHHPRLRRARPSLALLFFPAWILVVAVGVAMGVGLAACGDGSDAAGSGADVTREERPDGVTLVRYAALPDDPTHIVEPDLILGVMEGEPWEMFGDIRAVDAGSDGTIYILDFQARAVRVHDAQGTYLRTLGGPGDGPGEISQANGLWKEPGGHLWVNDHGKMRILALRPDGTEVLRAPFPVPAFGFVWGGERDAEGRFWGARAVPVGDRPAGPPPPGLNESRFRSWFHAVHPETEARDSVFLGEQGSRSFVTSMAGGGFAMQALPFAPLATTLVDPAGGFWTTEGADWRVARLDPRGDTLLVVEAVVDRLPVTAQDRERLQQTLDEQGRMDPSSAREFMGAVPDRRPALSRVFLDDTGRLWVRRGETGSDAAPLVDVFSRDGTLEATVELRIPNLRAGIPPRVRNGYLYAVAQADEGFPIVVRAPVPF